MITCIRSGTSEVYSINRFDNAQMALKRIKSDVVPSGFAKKAVSSVKLFVSNLSNLLIDIFSPIVAILSVKTSPTVLVLSDCHMAFSN